MQAACSPCAFDYVLAMLLRYRTLFLVLAVLPLPTLALAATTTKAKTSPKPAAQAPAKTPAKNGTTRLGGTGAWEAFVDDETEGKICFLVGKPEKSEPVGIKRLVSMTITHRPSHKVENVVNFVSGYGFKENSPAELDVDAKKFPLFTDRDGAWARDAATDKAIVTAMAKGKQAVIRGTPAKGAATADHYSLKGFGATLGLLDKACGVKR